MNIDFIDTLKDVSVTLFGRIASCFLVMHVCYAIGFFFYDIEDSAFWYSLLLATPMMLFSLLGGIGLVTLPLMFLFIIIYARSEISPRYLYILAALALITGYV